MSETETETGHIKDYEDVTIYGLDAADEAQLMAWQNECTFAWITQDGSPMSLIMSYLRTDDGTFTLATAHGTKGLEWDHVVVLADGFPGRRSIADAVEPERALEEERRLAYVAWTRARRSLTLLFDPAARSPFLAEAFAPDELGLELT